ncbi:MAG TPA: hypothetical protein VFT59_02380 [Candidatus Saccharimonadales bacterium]|nr:hypothetical protein [Candidatus Saccharimonadales bacterium]
MNMLVVFVTTLIVIAIAGIMMCLMKRFRFGIGLLLVSFTGIFTLRLVLTSIATEFQKRSDDPAYIAYILRSQWALPAAGVVIAALLGFLFFQDKAARKEEDSKKA